MSDRERIFSRLRQSLTSGSLPDTRTPYPDYDDEVATVASRLRDENDLWESFAHNLRAVSGQTCTDLEELRQTLKDEGVTRGYCDPDLMDPIGDACVTWGLEVQPSFDRVNYDDYEFGITRASGAIAETGTLVLTDSETSDRLGALTPLLHIAVLNSKKLVRSIAQAIAQFGDEPNIIWATGPSKTGDVEGILIEGVHGPGVQICFRLDT